MERIVAITEAQGPPYLFVEGPGPIIATAIHAGHDLRSEVSAQIALSETDRCREEDPYTDLLTRPFDTRVIGLRSRFEVDLNRARNQAVYLAPDQAWGLQVWKGPPPPGMVQRSLALHTRFYQQMAALLDVLTTSRRFVLLDLHSYNHMRNGPGGPPAPQAMNPEVNLGTASTEPSWRKLIDRFTADLRAALPASTTCGENICFQGGYLSRWVNERYRDRGCAIALEFKKTFMDEWTGDLDQEHLNRLVGALEQTIPGLLAELGEPE